MFKYRVSRQKGRPQHHATRHAATFQRPTKLHRESNKLQEAKRQKIIDNSISTQLDTVLNAQPFEEVSASPVEKLHQAEADDTPPADWAMKHRPFQLKEDIMSAPLLTQLSLKGEDDYIFSQKDTIQKIDLSDPQWAQRASIYNEWIESKFSAVFNQQLQLLLVHYGVIKYPSSRHEWLFPQDHILNGMLKHGLIMHKSDSRTLHRKLEAKTQNQVQEVFTRLASLRLLDAINVNNQMEENPFDMEFKPGFCHPYVPFIPHRYHTDAASMTKEDLMVRMREYRQKNAHIPASELKFETVLDIVKKCIVMAGAIDFEDFVIDEDRIHAHVHLKNNIDNIPPRGDTLDSLFTYNSIEPMMIDPDDLEKISQGLPLYAQFDGNGDVIPESTQLEDGDPIDLNLMAQERVLYGLYHLNKRLDKYDACTLSNMKQLLLLIESMKRQDVLTQWFESDGRHVDLYRKLQHIFLDTERNFKREAFEREMAMERLVGRIYDDPELDAKYQKLREKESKFKALGVNDKGLPLTPEELMEIDKKLDLYGKKEFAGLPLVEKKKALEIERQQQVLFDKYGFTVSDMGSLKNLIADLYVQNLNYHRFFFQPYQKALYTTMINNIIDSEFFNEFKKDRKFSIQGNSDTNNEDYKLWNEYDYTALDHLSTVASSNFYINADTHRAHNIIIKTPNLDTTTLYAEHMIDYFNEVGVLDKESLIKASFYKYLDANSNNIVKHDDLKLNHDPINDIFDFDDKMGNKREVTLSGENLSSKVSFATVRAQLLDLFLSQGVFSPRSRSIKGDTPNQNNEGDSLLSAAHYENLTLSGYIYQLPEKYQLLYNHSARDPMVPTPFDQFRVDDDGNPYTPTPTDPSNLTTPYPIKVMLKTYELEILSRLINFGLITPEDMAKRYEIGSITPIMIDSYPPEMKNVITDIQNNNRLPFHYNTVHWKQIRQLAIQASQDMGNNETAIDMQSMSELRIPPMERLLTGCMVTENIVNRIARNFGDFHDDENQEVEDENSSSEELGNDNPGNSVPANIDEVVDMLNEEDLVKISSHIKTFPFVFTDAQLATIIRKQNREISDRGLTGCILPGHVVIATESLEKHYVDKTVLGTGGNKAERKAEIDSQIKFDREHREAGFERKRKAFLEKKQLQQQAFAGSAVPFETEMQPQLEIDDIHVLEEFEREENAERERNGEVFAEDIDASKSDHPTNVEYLHKRVGFVQASDTTITVVDPAHLQTLYNMRQEHFLNTLEKQTGTLYNRPSSQPIPQPVNQVSSLLHQLKSSAIPPEVLKNRAKLAAQGELPSEHPPKELEEQPEEDPTTKALKSPLLKQAITGVRVKVVYDMWQRSKLNDNTLRLDDRDILGMNLHEIRNDILQNIQHDILYDFSLRYPSLWPQLMQDMHLIKPYSYVKPFSSVISEHLLTDLKFLASTLRTQKKLKKHLYYHFFAANQCIQNGDFSSIELKFPDPLSTNFDGDYTPYIEVPYFHLLLNSPEINTHNKEWFFNRMKKYKSVHHPPPAKEVENVDDVDSFENDDASFSKMPAEHVKGYYATDSEGLTDFQYSQSLSEDSITESTEPSEAGGYSHRYYNRKKANGLLRPQEESDQDPNLDLDSDGVESSSIEGEIDPSDISNDFDEKGYVLPMSEERIIEKIKKLLSQRSHPDAHLEAFRDAHSDIVSNTEMEEPIPPPPALFDVMRDLKLNTALEEGADVPPDTSPNLPLDLSPHTSSDALSDAPSALSDAPSALSALSEAHSLSDVHSDKALRANLRNHSDLSSDAAVDQKLGESSDLSDEMLINEPDDTDDETHPLENVTDFALSDDEVFSDQDLPEGWENMATDDLEQYIKNLEESEFDEKNLDKRKKILFASDEIGSDLEPLDPVKFSELKNSDSNFSQSDDAPFANHLRSPLEADPDILKQTQQREFETFFQEAFDEFRWIPPQLSQKRKKLSQADDHQQHQQHH